MQIKRQYFPNTTSPARKKVLVKTHVLLPKDTTVSSDSEHQEVAASCTVLEATEDKVEQIPTKVSGTYTISGKLKNALLL